MALTQGSRSVVEYETKLKDLAAFVPELVGSKKMLASKFEGGLNLSIREKMSITGAQSFKQIVQQALRTEKLVQEDRRVREHFAKRRNTEFTRFSKKTRGGSASEGAVASGDAQTSVRQRGGQRDTGSASEVSGPRPSRSLPHYSS